MADLTEPSGLTRSQTSDMKYRVYLTAHSIRRLRLLNGEGADHAQLGVRDSCGLDRWHPRQHVQRQLGVLDERRLQVARRRRPVRFRRQHHATRAQPIRRRVVDRPAAPRLDLAARTAAPINRRRVRMIIASLLPRCSCVRS